MATQGKNDGDDSSAHGWDLFKWNRIANPPEALTAAVYGILFLIFLIVAVSGVVALWQLLAPIWTGASPAPGPTGTDPGADLRGRLLIIGALLTTPFLIWRLIVGHWAARAAQDQARVAQEQARIAQETARNTLFAKAIEQLGAIREGSASSSDQPPIIVPNVEVRLGAIYALEKIARDDLSMHWPIMETLSAYIRENVGRLTEIPANVSDLYKHVNYGVVRVDSDKNNALREYRKVLAPPRVDIQASITVIGRRTLPQLQYEHRMRINTPDNTGRIFRIDLSNCNLNDAVFSGLNFSHARFESSNLIDASFANTTLDGARFNDTHLEGALFSSATLRGSRLNAAHLEGASISGAHLEGAILSSAHLERAFFGEAIMTEANLDGVDLSSSDGLTQEQINVTFGNNKTKLPFGLKHPENENWLFEGIDGGIQRKRMKRWFDRNRYWSNKALG
jgi:uncharacterized protein YjbI with pentapeptide repeats